MKQRTRLAIDLMVVILGLAGVAFFTVGYVAHGLRKICGIIELIDDRNQKMPPTNDPDTVQFRRELHRYRQSIGC
jgi:hypothetical protein